MRISFTTAAESMIEMKDEFKDLVGYSHATSQIINTLDLMGFDCRVRDNSSPVGISVGFPSDYRFAPNQYKIGYTAWESTELKPGWKDRMLSCDELWATSTWTANVFKETLGKEDIHVYPHGIDMDWAPRRRSRKDVFRFLHIGEPQARKNGQLVVDSFIELFGNDPDYQLIMKAANINSTRIYNPDGSIAGGPDVKYNNIKIITIPLTHSQMVELYWKSNAMVYPTLGEGFGFIPLQAIATGMPVASTYEWAEYKDFITVPINSTLGPSQYPQLHPGNVYNVTKDEVKRSMLELVENYEIHAKNTFKNSFKAHIEYDWDKVTESTSQRLKNIFKSRGL
jgi:glycosyltransferase involved in cell wall biosynthesis